MSAVPQAISAEAPPPPPRLCDMLRAAIERLEASPKNAEQRIALAEAYFRLAVQPDTTVDDALDLLRKAESYDPCHPKLPFHLGRLRHHNGDAWGAVIEYRRALRLAPRSHRTYVHLTLALAQLSKNEQELGRDILVDLTASDDQRLAEEMVKLDALIEARTNPDAKLERPKKRAGANARADAAANSLLCRWRGLWKLLLFEEVVRPKPQKKKLGQFLDQGKSLIEPDHGASEYALACIFLLLDSPSLCRLVEENLRDAKLAAHRDRRALRMLAAICELGAAKSADEFVERAAAKIGSEELPAELVCCLHFAWYGTTQDISAVKAAELVDRYPKDVREQACFKEMLIAILDHHARTAWISERPDCAEILWRETVDLDPFRISVAHNLALVATKLRSQEKYDVAWERSSELRYLLAAAAGDCRVDVADRRGLHRSFAQQCLLRYSETPSGKRSAEPSKENMLAWLADNEALTSWLREWDLYYLNSRLGFLSDLHLLGVARDCSDEDADAALHSLLLEFENCLGSRRWAGIQVFLQLVKDLAGSACARVKDPVARKRDAHYEFEHAEAEQLADEAISHGLLLRKMLLTAVAASSPPARAGGYRVARALLCLPWVILQPICRNRGMVSDEQELTDIFFSDFRALVAGDLESDGAPANLDLALGVFRDCMRALPQLVEVRVWHCRFLLQAKRWRDAYDAALEALPHTDKMADRAAADTLQKAFIDAIDSVGLAQLPPELLRPASLEALAKMIEEGRRILSEYPRAARLRHLIAEGLIHLADKDKDKLDEAAKLLEEGLELVLNENQLQDCRRLLDKAGSRSRAIEAVGRIRALLESASKRTRDAVEMVKQDRTPANLRKARDEIGEAIHEAAEAEKVAQEAELAAWAEKARKLAVDMQEILDGMDKK